MFGEYRGDTDNPESRVGEQDTSVRDNLFTPNGAQNGNGAHRRTASGANQGIANTNGQNSPKIVTQRRKNGTIKSKELNSGLERPMTDISALIEEIGKGRK